MRSQPANRGAAPKMKTLYLDVFSGISGDMFLGAMIDLGVDSGQLERELGNLSVGGYHLHAARRQNGSIAGIKFDVHLEADQEHGHGHEHGKDQDQDQDQEHEHGHGHFHGREEARDFGKIRKLIQESSLSEWVKQRAISIFHRVAVAEGKVHGQPLDKVHFHEVGAIDSIVDIVGACIALEILGKPRVVSAPVVEGTGWVTCAHGRFPVPTTATLEILGARGIAISQCEEPHELVTPTGAALLAEFAEAFEPMRSLVAEKIGYGLGTRENKTRPNVLRAVLGEVSQVAESTWPVGGQSLHDWEIDTIAVLETNIDDCSGEILGYFVERALAAGALDVFHTPIQMKKNRPGVLLTVLCAIEHADRFSELLLRETSAFGVRRTTMERRKLSRECVSVQTPQGEVRLKLGKLDGKVLRATPEFESCRRLAAAAGVGLSVIYEMAERAGRDLRDP